MQSLWLVPILPLAGAFVLLLFGARLPRRWVAILGCGSVGWAWVASLLVTRDYFRTNALAFDQPLYQWLSAAGLRVPLGLYLDPLSLVMINVITLVSFLILLYSVEFMRDDDSYARFFGYMNLFVGAMLLLVLGDNFLSLYVGWEGVGLCSYLLIGFWYRDRANGRAARKAFLMTRIGDTALLVGLFLLFARAGTLDIQTALTHLSRLGPALPVIAVLLLAGAVGKSAQLPLQTWLPDAMAGPTPVSALIHAATMVTAGVYLIARTHPLFLLSQTAMSLVLLVGLGTALYGGLCALAQRDLKRVLAYSTMSQVGYMFLALGVGAFAAGLFHFLTHAFFKALLFLAAGIVIQAQREEHDIYRMGGLWRTLPVAGWTFLAGAASLAALPLITAGFYSKDLILWQTYASPLGSFLVFGLALAGDFLTSLYIFRAFFLVFFGPPTREVSRRPGVLMRGVVVVLALFSLGVGLVGLPPLLGGSQPLIGFLDSLFGVLTGLEPGGEVTVLILSALASFAGLGVAFYLYQHQSDLAALAERRPILSRATAFVRNGMGFDWIYEWVFVRPYVVLARLDRKDIFDYVYTGLAYAAAGANRLLSLTQTGRVRNYATALAFAGAVLVALLLFLR